ncbi:hypothetical protein VIGAN_01520300 [Vigna angularis var. angularis]|uniref:Uncharacterized protein n=1 Tax=Vigna angularis var. angularis TaxID=157739 RepID=A0A0S3R9H9_PHAAN|nr:hypothetical protein VIGAN_01520300 [Vigna angularis var. angularis]
MEEKNNVYEMKCFQGPSLNNFQAQVVKVFSQNVWGNNSANRNINHVSDRLKLDEHHSCTNVRKRPTPVANLDDSRKPTKLSNIQVQENFCSVTRLTGEKSSVDLQQNTRAPELDPQMGSVRSKCCQREAQNLNPSRYPAVNSFKLDGMVTSGLVRLVLSDLVLSDSLALL